MAKEKESTKKRDSKQDKKNLTERKKDNDDQGNKFGGLPDRDLKKNLGCGG